MLAQASARSKASFPLASARFGPLLATCGLASTKFRLPRADVGLAETELVWVRTSCATREHFLELATKNVARYPAYLAASSELASTVSTDVWLVSAKFQLVSTNLELWRAGLQHGRHTAPPTGSAP